MNIASMKKSEILKRNNYRCVHGHTGLDHPQCYNEEVGEKERIGFFDIECSNLNADFGIVLSYCIKAEDGPILSRLITPEELRSGIFDRRLMEQFCEDAHKFDRLIGFYSARFDMPFLRTRSIFYKLNFPRWKELKHTDVYDIAKRKLNLHSRRLGILCSFFGIEAKEHPLTPSIWVSALSGDEKALKFILTHNQEDVISTEKLWHRIRDYSALNDTSI